MGFEEIVKFNKQVNRKIEKLAKELRSLKDELRSANSHIKTRDLYDYDYKTLKEKLESVRYVDSKTADSINIVLEKVKIGEFPIFTMARYYPVINQMDFLTNKEKVDLDTVLRSYELNQWVHIHSEKIRLLNHSESELGQILEFLVSNKILCTYHNIYCKCGNGYELLTGEELSQLIEDFKTKPLETEFYVSCVDCETYITSLDTLIKNKKVDSFRLIKEPDCSTDLI